MSLLERLDKHYKDIGVSASSYCNFVADNYRCNESIARFLSTVIYKNKRINTQIFVDVHPRASFPFIFYCCDIDRVVRAPQESAFEVEADAVLNQLDYYLDKSKCPREWRSYQFSVITPTRNQVSSCIKDLFSILNQFRSILLDKSSMIKKTGRKYTYFQLM